MLALAQQVGSGHEDISMDESLLLLRQVVIGGDEGHVAPLITFSQLVLEMGANFITFLSAKHGYNPKYLKIAH